MNFDELSNRIDNLTTNSVILAIVSSVMGSFVLYFSYAIDNKIGKKIILIRYKVTCEILIAISGIWLILVSTGISRLSNEKEQLTNTIIAKVKRTSDSARAVAAVANAEAKKSIYIAAAANLKIEQLKKDNIDKEIYIDELSQLDKSANLAALYNLSKLARSPEIRYRASNQFTTMYGREWIDNKGRQQEYLNILSMPLSELLKSQSIKIKSNSIRESKAIITDLYNKAMFPPRSDALSNYDTYLYFSVMNRLLGKKVRMFNFDDLQSIYKDYMANPYTIRLQ
ncbi:hypothetical protein [Fibrella arboris]|uniref:hypothetical protein n=1 Tax=Fibrella arboris TaxID=3242486 RepID=UPI00352103D0